MTNESSTSSARRRRDSKRRGQRALGLAISGTFAAAAFGACPTMASAITQPQFTNAYYGATFEQGALQSFTVTASGGSIWDPSGQLPPGMSFTGGSHASNVLTFSGVPTTAGDFKIKFGLSDQFGNNTYQVYDFNVVAAGTFYHTVRNTDGSLQNWTSPGGFVGSVASIASMPDGSTQLVGEGADGCFYHNIRFANGSWQGWAQISGGCMGGKSVAITGMPNGSSQLASVDRDGNVFHNIRFADGSWQGWARVPGRSGGGLMLASKVSIAGMSNGDSQVLIYSSDYGTPWLTIRSASTASWTDWQNMGTHSYNLGINGVSIARLADGSSRFVASDGEGKVWENGRSIGGAFAGWRPLTAGPNGPQMVATALSIAGQRDGTSQVVGVGSDGIVDLNTLDGSGTSTGFQALRGIDPTQQSTPFSGSQVAIAGMRKDGTTQILATVR